MRRADPSATRPQVFGTNPWLWLLPVWGGGPAGDGVHWPSRPGAADADETDDDASGELLERGEGSSATLEEEGRRLVGAGGADGDGRGGGAYSSDSSED